MQFNRARMFLLLVYPPLTDPSATTTLLPPMMTSLDLTLEKLGMGFYQWKLLSEFSIFLSSPLLPSFERNSSPKKENHHGLLSSLPIACISPILHSPLDVHLTSDNLTLFDSSCPFVFKSTKKKHSTVFRVLCGFGWLCDNMWLQSVAIILPRVQIHFRISDRWIGLLSTSVFFGMMLGAWIWGSYSDSYGRRGPFNGTLLMTAIFGLLCGFAPGFPWLCLSLLGLGIGVGGSMPTDGTFFLENIPKTYHYLLTGLSTFFSFGAVISSLLGLIILPRSSCQEPTSGQTLLCNSERDNLGWRYLLITLGAITLAMFGCRVSLLNIEESPKYLISSGRAADAILALESISLQNGTDLIITEADVEDVSLPEGSSHHYTRLEDDSLSSSTSATRTNTSLFDPSDSPFTKGIQSLRSRFNILIAPEHRITTILIWSIWAAVSFGFTSFNVFLPTYLEKAHPDMSIEKSMKECLLYTISGCPGSLLASWMIETRLGRRKSMVLSTLGTSIGILAFLKIPSDHGITLSSMFISLMSTIMYAVLYGYTPGLFPPSIRGTGFGIASAFSRLSGMIGPLIVGLLIKIGSLQAALWMSVLIFFLALGLMCKLPIETSDLDSSFTRVDQPNDVQ